MTVGIAPDPNDGFELISGAFASGLSQGQNATNQSITAHAGGAQPLATAIRPAAALVAITAVATGGDSVGLPRAKKGEVKMVLNATATSANIFAYPGSTDTINGVATGTAYALAGAKAVIFFCPKDGVWGAVLTA